VPACEFKKFVEFHVRQIARPAGELRFRRVERNPVTAAAREASVTVCDAQTTDIFNEERGLDLNQTIGVVTT